MKIINLIENNPNVDFSIPFKMALESGENRITGINTLNRNFIKLKQAVDNDDRRADYERKWKAWNGMPILTNNTPEPKFIPNIKLVDAVTEFAKYYINVLKINERFYSILEQLNYPQSIENLMSPSIKIGDVQKLNRLQLENIETKLEFGVHELEDLFDRVTTVMNAPMTDAMRMGNSNKYRRKIHESVLDQLKYF